MQCPVCGHRNPTNASTCAQCGQPLSTAGQATQICPECGADCALTARVCPHCRQPLPLPERRLLGRGTVLANRYRIERLLGWGGFGAVYLAQDLRFQQRKVALKENHDLSVLHAFLKEAELLATLQHPNLPRVSDFFQEHLPTFPFPRAYMVMDYIAGESLDERVERREQLSCDELLRLMRGIFDALEYLHSLRPPVFHRDIKPQNIRITPDGRAVLVDFGIAKVGKGMTTVAARAATPPFSPPEQYRMSGATDDKSDQYALAMTMYVALTGQVPTHAEATARLHALASNRPDPLTPLERLRPDIPRHVACAIMKALSVDKDQRFPSIAEFRRALYPPKVMGLTRRQLVAAIVSTLCLSGLIGLAGYQVWKWRQPLWLLTELKGHQAGVTWVAFAPDAKRLLSASHDGTIIVWDWQRRRKEWVLRGHRRSVRTAVFLEPPLLASAGWDGTVRLWDWRAGKPRQTLNARIGRLHAIAVSTDFRWLAAGGDKGFCLWRREDNRWRPHRFSFAPIAALVFHPDDYRLFVGDFRGWLHVLDIAKGTSLRRMEQFLCPAHEGAITALAIHPNGKWLLSGGEDAALIVWEITEEGVFVHKRLSGWHLKEIRALAFRHDGAIAVSCSMDDTLRVWRTDQWHPVFTHKGGQNWSLALSFALFHDLLASASKDETVKVWRLRLSLP